MNYKLDLKPIGVIKGNHNVQPGGKVQIFIDNECIRLMAPYTPYQSGALQDSVTLGSKIGNGDIKQNIPYGRYQYYGKLMVSSVTGSSWARNGESKVLTDKDLAYNTSRHPKAGPYWFERMKADSKKNILNGAQKIADRG